MAWPKVLQSQSHEKPSQSHEKPSQSPGFQAKPGRNITRARTRAHIATRPSSDIVMTLSIAWAMETCDLSLTASHHALKEDRVRTENDTYQSAVHRQARRCRVTDRRTHARWVSCQLPKSWATITSSAILLFFACRWQRKRKDSPWIPRHWYQNVHPPSCLPNHLENRTWWKLPKWTNWYSIWPKYAYLSYYTKWIRIFRIKCAQNMTCRISPIWYNLFSNYLVVFTPFGFFVILGIRKTRSCFIVTFSAFYAWFNLNWKNIGNIAYFCLLHIPL